MRLITCLVASLLILSLHSLSQPGALDRNFATDGFIKDILPSPSSTSSFIRIGVQSNGKMIVVNQDNNGPHMERFNTDGTLDNSFGNSGKQLVAQGIADMAIQSDDKIVIAKGNRVTRFNPGGSIDETFGTSGVVTIEQLSVVMNFLSIVVDSKGRIIVAGDAAVGTSPVRHTTVVACLNSDGSLDTDFYTGTGVRIELYDGTKSHSLADCGLDGNDKIVIAVMVGGISDKDDIVVRYKSDGKLDTDFGDGDGIADVNEDLRKIAVDKSSAKIAYTTQTPLTTSGSPYPAVGYLSADGTRHGLGLLPVKNAVGVAFQTDGKMVFAGGGYGFYLTVERFNSDGSIDRSFFNNEGIAEPYTTDYSDVAEVAFYNKRLFIAGSIITFEDLPSNTHHFYGVLFALDGTGIRLNCNYSSVALTFFSDAGKCSATINDAAKLGPAFIPADVSASVSYKISRNGSVIEQGNGSVNGKEFQVGITQVEYSYTDITTQTCSFNVTILDREAPVAKGKNITVQLDASGSVTITANQVDDGSSDPCGIKSESISKSIFTCSDVGPNTVTLTVTDNNNNQSTTQVTVTVEDKTPPAAKSKNVSLTLDANGMASVTAAQIDDGSTDACGIKSLGLSKTSFDCSNTGANQVTLTVTDNNNNSSTATATVTVTDNIPPAISSVVANPSLLWPADRKMKNVTINTLFADNCPGTACRITNVVIKAGEFAGDNINPDWEITGNNTVNLRAEIPKKGVNRIYTVTITCTDASGNSTSASTDVVVAHNITSPASGATVRVGSTVSLSGNFWDIPGKKHNARWLIDDKTTINGTVTEPSGTIDGSVTGSYKFNSAGVYKLQMNVTDQNGVTTYANTNENLEAIVVVYDPNGGYTYGGGSFASPAGALKSDPNITGDVSYGFTVNYYKGAVNPKGETQFEFKLGDLEFNAVNFDYLSISGAKAQFKGSGRITGDQSGYAFIMTVIDGQLDGAGIDKIRIKIYNKNTDEIIYDNQPGASDADNAVTPVAPNSSIIISSSAHNTMTIRTKPEQMDIASTSLEINTYPNPSSTKFNLRVSNSNRSGPIQMQVMDAYGRLIETRSIISNQNITFGQRYGQGAYYMKIIQGKEQKEVKLIKLNN